MHLLNAALVPGVAGEHSSPLRDSQGMGQVCGFPPHQSPYGDSFPSEGKPLGDGEWRSALTQYSTIFNVAGEHTSSLRDNRGMSKRDICA